MHQRRAGVGREHGEQRRNGMTEQRRRTPTDAWPVLRQLRGDLLGRGRAARSRTTDELAPRTSTADRVVDSVCPYCAVGCGQKVFVKDERVVQIEGDPDSPVSRGRLCPKGSATLQLTTGSSREHFVLYRKPFGTGWERLDLDTALSMVADRLIGSRARGWQDVDDDGHRLNRTMGVASLGGATLDNEENYLIKKLFTGLGIVQIENQARVCHSSTVVALGTTFGRGGSTTSLQDLQHADCIVIEGSNFAEAHPVGFQWVMEAKLRGAKIIHVDPRFTRTTAVADKHIPLRVGTDIALLGGLINLVLSQEKYFREYVLAYTNASTLVSEDFVDTDDLAGVFSGLHEDADALRTYDESSWQYAGSVVAAASGDRDLSGTVQHRGEQQRHQPPTRDETLQNPRCVLNVLRRHYARYTPEMVEEITGISAADFHYLADAVTENSGRERTTAFAYAVGWTQHTTGSQYIRTAAILQLLLGNIGRKGGGIMALRGHASIQGSSDIPTLFDTLPGYLPTPKAASHPDLDAYVAADAAEVGYWANMRAYMVSLLKAYYGPNARPDNDFGFGFLPRIDGPLGTYQTVEKQLAGECEGYFLMGENPAVGSANAKAQRMAMANLDWLVVRDFSLIESATWWKDGPEIETGEMRTEDLKTEVFFFPAAAHTEKSGTFTNTNRMLQWHAEAVKPADDQRSDLWFVYHLGRIVLERLRLADHPRDASALALQWDYDTSGPLAEPSAEHVLQEINGFGPDGLLEAYTQLKDDGSTSCGAWIYCGVYAGGVNRSALRTPAVPGDWLGHDWGWAWPANRRILYNRASAAPDGTPWSTRKALVWWDPAQADWTGHDVPDVVAGHAPDYVPPVGATGPEALHGTDPFIMQSDGRGWLYAPAGLLDGPLPTHYEPQDSPFDNALYAQSRNPVREMIDSRHNHFHPSGSEPGAEVFPYVVTTYRLTEHFTAGGMTRWSPYLAELQPEMFCEVGPELAAERGLENAGWATVVTARGVIEARVLVTDRVPALTVQGRRLHQIGLPYHWGHNGYSTGDSANEITAMALDPNAHIQEVKALTADIQPGRRPRGPALLTFLADYRERAGISETTGV
jgi:formate dehydrogenase major subunit